MNRKLVLRTFIAISLLVILPVAPARASSQTTVYVAPSTITVTVNQTFFININISDVIDLYGWEFKLKWNPTLLDVINVTEGDFLKSGGDTFFWPIMNNTERYILVDCTLLGNIPGVNGSGTLAIVEFKVESAGESILDLYDTKLVSSLEQPIAHQSTDGYGYFTPPHDVAVISIAVSPTTVLPDQSIHINVTVENQGGNAENFNVTAYYNLNVIETQLVSLNSGTSTILTFTWDTTSVDKGDYTILAEASVVSGETDTTDNTKVADTMVTVLSLGHDVAIKDVSPSKTVVGQGYSLSILITAKNYGSFTETFNVTVYYNETNPIAMQDITLTSGNSTTITFSWNTTGVPYGNYTISATATPVPDETETTDNTYTDGWVLVAIVGDVNLDGEVNVGDSLAVLIIRALGKTVEEEPSADVNCDGFINVGDSLRLLIIRTLAA